MKNHHKLISDELNIKIEETQTVLKTLTGAEISYIEATRVLARKLGMYKIPLNKDELKELEKLVGKSIMVLRKYGQQ
jgi:hypothetical protein